MSKATIGDVLVLEGDGVITIKLPPKGETFLSMPSCIVNADGGFTISNLIVLGEAKERTLKQKLMVRFMHWLMNLY